MKNVVYKTEAQGLTGVEHPGKCEPIITEWIARAGGISNSEETTIIFRENLKGFLMLIVKNLYVSQKGTSRVEPWSHKSNCKYPHFIMCICNILVSIIAKYNLRTNICKQTMQERCKWIYKWIRHAYHRAGVYRENGPRLDKFMTLMHKMERFMTLCLSCQPIFFFSKGWVGKGSTLFFSIKQMYKCWTFNNS